MVLNAAVIPFEGEPALAFTKSQKANIMNILKMLQIL